MTYVVFITTMYPKSFPCFYLYPHVTNTCYFSNGKRLLLTPGHEKSDPGHPGPLTHHTVHPKSNIQPYICFSSSSK